MNNRLAGVLMLVWFFAAVHGYSGGRQEASAPQPQADAVRIALGSTSAKPGESAVVPVYFTPAKDMHVGSMKLQVTFVSANLKFDKLETGIAAEIGEVPLTHILQVGKNDKNVEISSLTVEAVAAASSPAGIPSGLLAYIQMRVNDDARPATITLRTSAEATELGTARRLQIASSPGATVEVIAPGSEPAVVCFFFTH